MLDNNLLNTENSTQNAETPTAPHHKTASKGASSGERRTDKIFKFFSKAGIKKFVLILYCVVPLLIVSIGFAAWIITGNNASGTTGQFTAYGIINSYDYIELNTTDIGAIDFYATGFYDETNNQVVQTTAFTITYTLHMQECAKHLKSESGDKTALTADFELYFNSGCDAQSFFQNLECKVNVSSDTKNSITLNSLKGSNESSLSLEIGNTNTGVLKINEEQQKKYNNLKSANSHHIVLDITPNKDLTDTADVTLTFTYTLMPSSDDYKSLYELIASISSEKLAVDVKITD